MIPKVSICIPAYLQIPFLKQTIESVLVQNFDDYEIVITDDSPDSSVENLLKEYSTNTKIKYCRNKQQLGSPANWNESIKMARGEYIKIMHHDDWFAGPTSLSQFVEMLDSKPEAGFAFSGAIAQPASAQKAWHHFAPDSWISRLKKEPTCLFLRNVIGPPSSTIFRRSSFVEYDKALVWLVDIAQYMQILQKTSLVATQQPLIVSTTQAPHQITSSCHKNKNLNIFEHFTLLESISNRIPAEKYHQYIDKLFETLFKYNVRSLDEIRLCGFTGKIPEPIVSHFAKPVLLQKMLEFRLKIYKIAKYFSSLSDRIFFRSSQHG